MGANEQSQLAEVDLLRFITAGSVDDGKSTLIGRLLYDSKGIFEDQLSAVADASQRRGRGELDLSLLTDGLQAEREQGITIDVAYRYFATPVRKFIVADSPGHEQYTRNMVTGASTADAAIILLDARKGVLTQTRRHTFIAHLLGIRHLVFAINKMDLVGFSADVFGRIADEVREFAGKLGAKDLHVIPVSALLGDNIVERGKDMPWYLGPPLLKLLEEIPVAKDFTDAPFRYPVQGVARPTGADLDPKWHDFRGYTGRIETGRIRAGDEILVLPAGRRSRVTDIFTLDGSLQEAVAPQSVTLQLADQIDVSRGDMIVRADEALPTVASEFAAHVCWLAETPLDPSRRYVLKHTTRQVKTKVTAIDYRVDVNTLAQHDAPEKLQLNEIGRVRLKVQQPLALDAYTEDRATGAFILIDEATNNTVAAGMVVGR